MGGGEQFQHHIIVLKDGSVFILRDSSADSLQLKESFGKYK